MKSAILWIPPLAGVCAAVLLGAGVVQHQNGHDSTLLFVGGGVAAAIWLVPSLLLAVATALVPRPTASYQSPDDDDVVNLYENRLRVGDKVYPLSPQVSARVIVTGGLYEQPSATPGAGAMLVAGARGAAALSLLASRLRRPIDTRDVYLEIQGPGWFELIDCTIQDQVKVGLMANEINDAARRSLAENSA